MTERPSCEGTALAESVATQLAGSVRDALGADVAREKLEAIRAELDTDRGLAISQVVAGSAADRDGLKSGDRLISANGIPFGEDPMALLAPYLATGKRSSSPSNATANR